MLTHYYQLNKKNKQRLHNENICAAHTGTDDVIQSDLFSVKLDYITRNLFTAYVFMQARSLLPLISNQLGV